MVVRDSADQARMVDDLLDISRSTSGRLVLQLAMAAGFLEHIAKPVVMAKLTAKLDRLLSGTQPASSRPVAMS
jgi:hypothetical protein